ncbi:MAG: hypothetical protein ABEK01_04490 [Candidatus Nanohaloarchaea archaeon]
MPVIQAVFAAQNILIVVGIIVLAYGMHLSRDLRDMLGQGELKKAWDTPSILMGWLIAGYTAVLYNNIGLRHGTIPSVQNGQLVSSAVFFVAAWLVFVTTYYNDKVFEESVE